MSDLTELDTEASHKPIQRHHVRTDDSPFALTPVASQPTIKLTANCDAVIHLTFTADNSTAVSAGVSSSAPNGTGCSVWSPEVYLFMKGGAVIYLVPAYVDSGAPEIYTSAPSIVSGGSSAQWPVSTGGGNATIAAEAVGSFTCQPNVPANGQLTLTGGTICGSVQWGLGGDKAEGAVLQKKDASGNFNTVTENPMPINPSESVVLQVLDKDRNPSSDSKQVNSETTEPQLTEANSTGQFNGAMFNFTLPLPTQCVMVSIIEDSVAGD